MLSNIINFVSDYNDRPTHEELATANNIISQLQYQIEAMAKYFQGEEYINSIKKKMGKDLEDWTNEREEIISEAIDLTYEIEEMKEYLSDARLTKFLENCGFIESDYNLEIPEEYEDMLRKNKQRQREMLSNKSAITLTRNCSKDEPNLYPKMLDVFREILLAFYNTNCYQAMLDVTNIKTSYNAQTRKIHELNKYIKLLHIPIRCFITSEYETLKFAELYIIHMAQQKKFEHEIEEREIKKKIEHQKLARTKIEKSLKAAKNYEKEVGEKLKITRQHSRVNDSPELKTEIKQLEKELKAAVDDRKELEARTQLLTAGCVYVASNVGSFGNDIYLIGMTQELEPLDYIKELGNKSVPFPFDLHALIFSGNAIEFKNKLYQKFSEKRLNQDDEDSNFFKVSLSDVKLAIKEIMAQDKTAKAKMRFFTTHKATRYRKKLDKICNNNL